MEIGWEKTTKVNKEGNREDKVTKKERKKEKIKTPKEEEGTE